VTALIQIENLHFRPEPEGQDILRGIDLTIEAGAFIAIIGQNGSGKTTLIKHINGLLLPSQGSVLVDDQDTRLPENRARLQGMVGMVFQNPADQIVASTVAEDIAFGLENTNMPTAEIRTRVAEQMEVTGLTRQSRRPPHLLSGGQIQMVALAGVLARQPQVILFDEPTSMLDPQSRRFLLERIKNLHQQGMTIVYITHHMEEAVLADQVLVMHAGKVVLKGTPAEIFWKNQYLYEFPLEKPEAVMFAEKFQSIGWTFPSPVLTPESLFTALPSYSRKGQPHVTQSSHKFEGVTDPLISINNVHYTYLSKSPLAQKALDSAQLSVKAGSLEAIAGANGSGKSTLLQHINGILRPELGYVQVCSLNIEDPQTRLRDIIQKVGLVFQNPESQFFEVFVGDEIAYGPKQFGMDEVRERVRQAMAWVGLDFERFKDRRLQTLSGGEKRKVALASTLVLDQDILMFDEPTAGMDPQARDELLILLKSLHEKGKTIIIASHRMEELASVAENLTLMHAGRVTQTGPCGLVMTDTTAIDQAGLIPPLSVQISGALIDKGWPLVISETYTPERLFAQLEGWTA
jgi:energy-coupling factor transport system ATP-binding protein